MNMLLKGVPPIFKTLIKTKLNPSINVIRKASSALYITGDKAHNNFAVLTPHIDIVERFENRDILEDNIKSRGKYVDLEGICNRWAFYQDLMEKRVILEVTKAEIAKQISKHMKDEKPDEEAITHLKTQMTIVKDEYSTLRTFLYGVEESAALKALSLPNIIHERTKTEPVLIYEHLTKPEKRAEDIPSHIAIGTKENLLEIHDNTFAFLTNDAALFEIAALNYFHEKLTQSGLIQFSNTDFAKSIIIEGCGSDFEKNDIITLEDGGDHIINKLHLTGGASHYAFMAHFTKYLVPANQFPLNYFAIGRKYQQTIKDDEASLFNLVQQSAIEIFSACKTSEELNQSLDSIVKNIQEIYKGFGCHFRLSYVKASALKDYESLRVAIEMFSNNYNDYVEVGSISVVDEYLSKRLLFTYNENKEKRFAKVIVGNILNVQKVLACILENNYQNGQLGSIINDTLKPYIP